MANEPKIEKILLDLSGREGLSGRFYGDYPYSSGNSNLTLYGTDRQYAAGTVNPLAKYGYLSPANGTFITVNSDTTSGRNVIAATIVDEISSSAFFYDYSGVIRRVNPLTQTTVTATSVSVASTNGLDLEFYTIKGIRFLFFAYKTSSAANIGVWKTDTLTVIPGTYDINGTTGFLKYDTQAANFIIGETITGATSGATGIVQAQRDGGATGTLLLRSWNGTAYQSGENLNGSSAGAAAAKANGGYSSVHTTYFTTEVYDTVATTYGTFTFGNNNLQMIPADNGYMYILDGSAVHKFDGTTAATGGLGDVTPNALLFPALYTLIDGVDLRGRLWITLFRSSRDILGTPSNTGVYANYCGVYVWDRITSGASTEDFIEVSGVRDIRTIHAFQGVPVLFTVSATRYTQIRMWDGVGFPVVQELGPEAYPRFHNSVSIQGDMMTWQGNDGKIYSYGKIVPGTENKIWILGDISGQVATLASCGALLLANADQSASAGMNTSPEGYYLNIYDSNVTSKILKWYPHAQVVNQVTQNANAGNYRSIVKAMPKLSHIVGITLFYPAVGATSATTFMSVDLYLNQGTSSWGTTTVTGADTIRGFKNIPIGERNVNFLQIGLSWPTGQGLSILPTPSHAIVEYYQTGKKV